MFQNFEPPFIHIGILGGMGFKVISILLLNGQSFLQPIDMHFTECFPGVYLLLFLTI